MSDNGNISTYQQQGYQMLKGVLPAAEALALGRELRELIENYNRNATWEGEWLSGEQRERTVLLHLHSPEKYHAGFGRLLFDRRILDPVAKLIGEDIELHHTKGFVKPPEKGAPFPPHQDYPFFPHQDDRMLAMVLYLSRASEAMGCIRVWPGSHKTGPQQPVPGYKYLDGADWPPEKALALPGEPGDAVIFNYLTVHDSGPNLSADLRVTILLQLRNVENRPVNDAHPSFAQGLVLRGKKPVGP